MGKIIYFTGGARSGKSFQAEQYISNRYFSEKIYIATAIAFDKEMESRIEKHKKQREENWLVVEGYKNLQVKLSLYMKTQGVVLLDCLTNMVSNLMIVDKNINWDNISTADLDEVEAEIIRELESFLIFFKSSSMDLVVVSNEVGMGIVPAYPLGRYFRDICGKANQLVGKYSDEAYLIISGLKLKLK
ncbi:Adenosylcobinamide kinase [Fusobacterium necrogenes]|uniref:Adenosylcobinamide kinase n=1 Tax=Fusobacterium necrogenes TaxID=858 RepID=A0A377GX08_9FUSO|nr:bifunctional adenosylcobinamide kinase/adenosylcobinamide-phosphate guanylyltransferase [Fusobacterium necrogenes]STO31091.1 Adenosylcobinamide kinase [Fusobacterium necrogenes]